MWLRHLANVSQIVTLLQWTRYGKYGIPNGCDDLDVHQLGMLLLSILRHLHSWQVNGTCKSMHVDRKTNCPKWSPTQGSCALANSSNADYFTRKQSSPTTTNLRLVKDLTTTKEPARSQLTELTWKTARVQNAAYWLGSFSFSFMDIFEILLLLCLWDYYDYWKGVVWFASHTLEYSWTPPSLLRSNMTNPEDSVAVTYLKRYLKDTGILVLKISHWQIPKPISDERT